MCFKFNFSSITSIFIFVFLQLITYFDISQYVNAYVKMVFFIPKPLTFKLLGWRLHYNLQLSSLICEHLYHMVGDEFYIVYGQTYKKLN